MSNPNISGANAMSDSVDFIKKMWGGMGIPGMPGMVVPTLSVEEIDKKVADLKAVEGWLSLNLNMLRGTIQGLEVQSATLSALKSIVAISLPTAGSKSTPNFSGTSTTENATGGAAAWAAMASQFPFSFMPEKPKAAEETPPPPAAAPIFAPAPPAPLVPPQEDVSHAAAGAPIDNDHATASQTATGVQAPSTTAWWDVLQNQFKQVVSGVLAAEAKTAKNASEEPKSAAKPKSDPKSKGATVKVGAKTSSKASPKTSTSAATKAPRTTGAAKTSSTARNKKVAAK